MAVTDLFSKRMKRERGEVPDVYSYDQLPRPLRVQIIHIWRSTVGRPHCDDFGESNAATDLWGSFRQTLCRERGVFALSKRESGGFADAEMELADYFLKEQSAEFALDVVELVFALVSDKVEEWDYTGGFHGRTQTATDALEELNQRFREHGIGYQVENGKIIRVDSQFEHTEVVKPVLSLLREEDFAGANDEFLKAHEHHRHGRQKECIAECLKAFESTMKVICAQRGWAHDKNATAKALIEACLTNGLLPRHQESYLAGVRQTLESGVPTIRNKTSGHGQGTAVVDVPDFLAAYGLHMTAATIILLVEANKALKQK